MIKTIEKKIFDKSILKPRQEVFIKINENFDKDRSSWDNNEVYGKIDSVQDEFLGIYYHSKKWFGNCFFTINDILENKISIKILEDIK